MADTVWAYHYSVSIFVVKAFESLREELVVIVIVPLIAELHFS